MFVNQPDITEQTRDYQLRLQNKKFRSEPIRKVLKDRIEELESSLTTSKPVDNAYSLLHTLAWALSQPDLVDPELLASYLSQLIRLMENAGSGLDFREAIDRAIYYYQETGLPMVDLYLAKVEYLRLTDTESNEKEKILAEALKVVNAPEDKMKVLIKTIQYFNDSSQYKPSLKKCQEALLLVEHDESLAKYLAKIYDLLGIVYYYLFDYKNAVVFLNKACEYGEKYDEHTLGEALHYKGRVASDQGDLLKAMHFFTEGITHQQFNIADSAWYNLRMGNILSRSNLIQDAMDHLLLSQKQFSSIEYGGSAMPQVELAWSDIYKAQKKYVEAERHILLALKFSKETRFFRGQLLCLVSLFWFQLAYLHRLDKAIKTFFVAMTNEEVWRNGGLSLIFSYLAKVLVIPYKWLTNKSYTIPGTINVNTKIPACVCPIHGNKLTNENI